MSNLKLVARSERPVLDEAEELAETICKIYDSYDVEKYHKVIDAIRGYDHVRTRMIKAWREFLLPPLKS